MGDLLLGWRVRLAAWWSGPRWYAYTDVDGGSVRRMIRMPERDYLVRLQLQRVRRGLRTSWVVAWVSIGPGIPTTGPGEGRVAHSAVPVSDDAVLSGLWAAEATAAIAVAVTQWRTTAAWEPIQRVMVRNPLAYA